MLEENTNGYADVNTLINLLADGGNYLCISLSHSGQSIAGSDIHKHWFLDNINIIISRGDDPPTTTIVSSLELHQPISTIVDGDTITFTGRLTRTDDGSGISGKQITLKDSNTDIGSITTDSTGNFSFTWSNVEKLDGNDIIELFASFNGDSTFGPSASDIYYITINPYDPQAPLTPASPIAWQTFISTQQSNVGEVCDDFGAAIPHNQLSFGMTDNYRCYISVCLLYTSPSPRD